jgi:WD40 repeat protein
MAMMRRIMLLCLITFNLHGMGMDNNLSSVQKLRDRLIGWFAHMIDQYIDIGQKQEKSDTFFVSQNPVQTESIGITAPFNLDNKKVTPINGETFQETMHCIDDHFNRLSDDLAEEVHHIYEQRNGWKSAEPYPVATIDYHGLQSKIRLSANGRYLAFGSKGDLVLFDVRNQKVARIILDAHKQCILTTCFSPDGTQLFSGSEDGSIKQWDVETSTLASVMPHHCGPVSDLCMDTSDDIYSASHDFMIRIWDLRMLQGKCNMLIGHADAVNALYKPNYFKLFSASHDNTIRQWDMRTRTHEIAYNNAAVLTVIATADGKHYYSGDADNKVKVWEHCASEEKCIHTCTGHDGWVNTLGELAAGELICSGSDDGTMKIWQVKTGQCMHTLKAHDARITSLCSSPDQQRLYSSSCDDNMIKEWTAGSLCYIAATKAIMNSISQIQLNKMRRSSILFPSEPSSLSLVIPRKTNLSERERKLIITALDNRQKSLH